MKYDEIPAVRRSALWEIRKSPAHYKYAVEHPKEPTPALTFGIAAHKYILEPDDFWNMYMLAPEVDRRTKDGKAEWNRFQIELREAEKTGVTVSDYETIQEMRTALLQNKTAAALIETGKHEL